MKRSSKLLNPHQGCIVAGLRDQGCHSQHSSRSGVNSNYPALETVIKWCLQEALEPRVTYVSWLEPVKASSGGFPQSSKQSPRWTSHIKDPSKGANRGGLVYFKVI